MHCEPAASFGIAKLNLDKSGPYIPLTRNKGSGEACLGAYPGVGAFHSTRQNSYIPGRLPRILWYLFSAFHQLPMGKCKLVVDYVVRSR